MEPFILSDYFRRMEENQLRALEERREMDWTITLWWGLDGLEIPPEGEPRWIRRGRQESLDADTVECEILYADNGIAEISIGQGGAGSLIHGGTGGQGGAGSLIHGGTGGQGGAAAYPYAYSWTSPAVGAAAAEQACCAEGTMSYQHLRELELARIQGQVQSLVFQQAQDRQRQAILDHLRE